MVASKARYDDRGGCGLYDSKRMALWRGKDTDIFTESIVL
jgi:hypothetical protein